MNFAFNEEQDELRRMVTKFLQEKSPETEVRRLMATTEGYDAAVWSQMAEQLGLQALTIPEEFGGAGFSYVELIVVLEEMGAALLCAPYFSTVALAANALLTSGDDAAKSEYLPGIASGETIATLAITDIARTRSDVRRFVVLRGLMGLPRNERDARLPQAELDRRFRAHGVPRHRFPYVSRPACGRSNGERVSQ